MLWIGRAFCHLCGRIEWCNFHNKLMSQFKWGFSACRTSDLSALVASLCVFPRISSGVGRASSCGFSMALLMLFTGLIIFQRASSRYFPLPPPDCKAFEGKWTLHPWPDYEWYEWRGIAKLPELTLHSWKWRMVAILVIPVRKLTKCPPFFFFLKRKRCFRLYWISCFSVFFQVFQAH